MPQPRALVARESTIAVTDVTLKATAFVLTWASIKLQWEDKTLWCFHRPAGGSKHECHDKDGKKDKDFDFDFHMEDKDLVAHNFHPKFWVSRKPWHGGEEKVVSVDMGKVKCTGADLAKVCLFVGTISTHGTYANCHFSTVQLNTTNRTLENIDQTVHVFKDIDISVFDCRFTAVRDLQGFIYYSAALESNGIRRLAQVL